MGRTLPVECKHNVVVDYGDFGPCQGYCDEVHPESVDCPDFPECEQCAAEHAVAAARERSIGDALATALGALYEFAANGCDTDRRLAAKAIEDVNAVLLGPHVSSDPDASPSAGVGPDFLSRPDFLEET